MAGKHFIPLFRVVVLYCQGKKNTSMMDTIQDHSGHCCFHQHMMIDQLIVQGLECGQDHGDGYKLLRCLRCLA